MIGKVLAHYRITALLGRGGMGEVYRAHDTRLQRDVALKVLSPDVATDPERIARLRREAQTIASLDHPSIVTVHSIEEAGGTWFLTMELVEGDRGVDLARSRPPVQFLQRLALGLCDALASAHDRGVVHRDLKPANLMVTKDGRVKILDFGLAKILNPASADHGADTEVRTQPGRIVGTQSYMSPEQIQGLEAGPASDIFSLGVTLYEIATGTHPFNAPTTAETVAAILRDRPRPVAQVQPDLPPVLAQMIDECLSKEREDRPTARDLRGAFDPSNPEPPASTGSGESVAVLPFADLSPDQDQDYLCDGLAEELMNALTKIEGLKVASRTSCHQFKNVAADIREIGKQLGVKTIVEGSVQKAGNRLRISAQLTKVDDGYQLWAERYDRELENVFEIQEDIAGRIVSTLELTLSPRERRALQSIQTSNPLAYEFYLRGNYYQHRMDRQSLDTAREMFERAIELDPQYARAYAGLADCVAYTFILHDASAVLGEVVDRASAKAMDLDPQLPEAHVARGQAHLIRGDYDAANEAFDSAMRLDPRSFEAHYFCGRSCFGKGDLDRALEMFRRAAELKPDDHQSLHLQALIHQARGEHELRRQKLEESLVRINNHLALDPNDVRARYFGGSALIGIGEREVGLRWVREARAMRPNDPHVGYNVACALTNAGEYDEALDCLESVVDAFKSTSYYVDWLRSDPDFDPLRGMERFEHFVERLKRQ